MFTRKLCVAFLTLALSSFTAQAAPAPQFRQGSFGDFCGNSVRFTLLLMRSTPYLLLVIHPFAIIVSSVFTSWIFRAHYMRDDRVKLRLLRRQ